MKLPSPIIKPLVTEKSVVAQESKRYAFLVRRSSTKKEIREAVEENYGVKVAKISTAILPGKKRLVGRGKIFTKRPVFKRAIVVLKDRKSIDPNKLKDSKKK